MSGSARFVQQAFRAVAVVAGLAALGGVVALAAVALFAAEQAGYAVPVEVPITEDQAQQFVIAGGLALVGGIVGHLVANTIASFAAGFRSGTVVAAQRSGAGEGGADGAEGAGAGPSVPVSERHRRKLGRLYLWITGFIALIVVVGSLGSAASTGSALDIALVIAAIALELLFGGLLGGVIVVALLLGLWYGVRQRATEALVAGFAVAVLFLATAIAIRSIGWIFLGLTLLYYNFLARGATEFQWMRADALPGPIREFVQ